MKLSIVSTLYNSAEYVEEFTERCQKVAHQLVGQDYEIILVDDGSPDNSLQIAIDLVHTLKNLRVIELSRNFGHHHAMMAGLNQAQGKKIFLLDSDLEENPEWLVDFNSLLETKELDVVYGQQMHRKGYIFERISGFLWYRFFNFIASINHPHNIVTARLMTKDYVRALLAHQETGIVISCLWYITGFKQEPLQINKKHKGKSSYNITKKFAHAVNATTSFTEKPLYFLFYIGLSILCSSILFSIYLTYKKFIAEQILEGWVSIMVSIWLVGGILLSSIGLIGIYIAKVFIESKKRPNYLIKRIHIGE
jgi:putative glycosyltransferase